MTGTNFDLKEQIRAYWSARAATFDESFSHQVSDGTELTAWADLYSQMYGEGKKHVLDLGCGTGEVSKIQFALGHRVTGIDFSETMLEIARKKHGDKAARGVFISGDAEDTRQPDASFDALTCRHLIWTLLNPQDALKDWFRVLRPGGHLVIFDGNFMAKSLKDLIIRRLISRFEPQQRIGEAQTSEMQQQNEHIRAQLPFASGFKFTDLENMVKNAGFERIERCSYSPIRRAQRRIAGPADWLRSFTTDRFVLHARKPMSPDLE